MGMEVACVALQWISPSTHGDDTESDSEGTKQLATG